jgi:hypothetical protein
MFSSGAECAAELHSYDGCSASLVRLEFPKSEMQIYGNIIIVYTTYLYEVEVNGKRTRESGRGTEIFVRRGDELVNAGWHLDSGK